MADHREDQRAAHILKSSKPIFILYLSRQQQQDMQYHPEIISLISKQRM
jgi:hypothetical protein